MSVVSFQHRLLSAYTTYQVPDIVDGGDLLFFSDKLFKYLHSVSSSSTLVACRLAECETFFTAVAN